MPTLGAVLEPFLQVPVASGRALGRHAADDVQREQLADPVPLEVERDRDPRSCAVAERLDGDGRAWPERSVDTVTGPAPGRTELRDLLRRRLLDAPDPADGGEPRSHAGGRPPSKRTRTTSSCHSANREGSVTYAKTSSGGRSTSNVDTIGGIVLLVVTAPAPSSRAAGVGSSARPCVGRPRTARRTGRAVSVPHSRSPAGGRRSPPRLRTPGATARSARLIGASSVAN